MSRSVQRPGPTPDNIPPKQVLSESLIAYQIPSGGGLLKTEDWGLWQWIVFIFSGEWITGIIQAYQTRAHHINLLFDRAQTLLAGRISNETADAIKTWLETKATPDWLVDFAKFLNEADRLESAKPTTFHLAPETETLKLTTTLFTNLMTEDAIDNRVISSMLREICFLTTANNTQDIGHVLKPESRFYPYLHSSQYNGASFCLLTEARPEQQRLHVTDPVTKATQTIRLNPNDTEETHQLQLAQAIYKLSQPNPKQGSMLVEKDPRKRFVLEAEQKKEFIEEGNIYKVGDRLSLCPYPQELFYAGTDLKALDRAEALISGSVGGEMEMPIDSPLRQDKIQVEVTQTDDKCGVTYKLGEETYTTTYPLKSGETLPQLARRIREDHTLERDLLLVRSYFVRSKG